MFKIELKRLGKRFAAGVVCAMLMVQSVCFAGNGVIDLSPNRENLEKRYEEHQDIHGEGYGYITWDDLIEDAINSKFHYCSNKGYGPDYNGFKSIMNNGDTELKVSFLLCVSIYLNYGVDYWAKRAGTTRENYIKLNIDKDTGYNMLMHEAIVNSLAFLRCWWDEPMLFHISDGKGRDITGDMSGSYWWLFGGLDTEIITEEGEKRPFAECGIIDCIKFLSADGMNGIVESIIQLKGGDLVGKWSDGRLRDYQYTVANSPLSILFGNYNIGTFGDLQAYVLYSEDFQHIKRLDLLNEGLRIAKIINEEREFRGIE